jgi:hypothetical protein
MDNSDVKDSEEFFEICRQFRTKKKINDNDYVFLLTEYKNSMDFFGWTDETLGNYFIQTSEWNLFFDAEINKHFPISYEVVAWILRSLMYDTQDELLNNAHMRARGCVMDFCDDKEDIILKMRTGDVCNTCLKRIKERVINPSLMGNIFNTMENIRKGLMYRTRNEMLGTLSPLRIDLRGDNPKFVLTDMNNLELKFNPSQTAIYLTILKLGGLKTKCLADYEEDILESYLSIKHEPKFETNYRTIVREWINPINPTLFTEKISKMNRTLRDLLGEDLASYYKIHNIKGVYQIKLKKNDCQIIDVN